MDTPFPTPESAIAVENAPHVLTRGEIVILGEGLPAAPRILGQLTQMLADVDVDVKDIAGVLRLDPALAARAIRLSNTIMFGPVTGEVADIEEALTRVGMANVLPLVGAAGVTQWLSEPLEVYGIDVDTFQRSSLCHALAAEHLARAVGAEAPVAYVGGLLRSIGMIVLDRAADLIKPKCTFAAAQDKSYSDFERRVFGFTSTEATRILMDEWRFPGAIVEAIDCLPLDTPEAISNRMACIINIAGEIASAAGYGLPGDAVHWTAAAPVKYELLGITPEMWSELSAAAQERSAAVCDLLRIR